MLQAIKTIEGISPTPNVIVEVKDLKEGDFSIKEGNVLEIEMKKENFLKSLDAVLSYVIENKGMSLVAIKKLNIIYNIDLAIQLFLLSYKYQKLNILIETNEEEVFKDIKNSLNKILEIKKNVCNGDSMILKERLLSMYPILSNTIQKIVDNTYPKEEVDLKGKRVIIIDNHNFFHRNFHGMPDMRDSNGRPTNIIKALTTLIKDIESKNPDFVIFANEGTQTTNKRKEILSTYKEHRNPLHEDLRVQIPICLDLLSKMNISVVEKEGYEADDIIASYSKSFSEAGAFVEVHTSDKDLYQILDGENNISIFNPMTKNYIKEEDCFKKFGVGFNKCLMVQAIMGDSTDDVPGIKGIGVKTAAELMLQYGNLDNLYANVESIPGKKGEKLREGKENAYKSLELVKMYNDLAENDIMIKSIMPKSPLNKILKDLSSFEINV